MNAVVLDRPLSWRDIVAIADGAALELSRPVEARIDRARELVDALIDSGQPVYGITTGVGALSSVAVNLGQQRALSRNILMSHAAGMGAPLFSRQVRAIIAAQINNFAHGYSGVRREVATALQRLLEVGCIPEVPAQGSVGYLTHMAHIGLVLIGEGAVQINGRSVRGSAALTHFGLTPIVLDAKEGLSLVNGTPCAAGLAALVLARAERLLDWADAIAAMSFEALGGQIDAFDADILALRISPGLQQTGLRLRTWLAGSGLIAAAKGQRLQDALSLRAIPHVHGAARDGLEAAARTVDRELASVTDNPVVTGTPDAPKAHSEAHAVSPALGLAMDGLAIGLAEVAAMAERRLDRLVNPLVSGLPAFLATETGVASGYMIAQYAAAGLVGENRRLAAPASLDGGVTSGLQEDHLSHATPAALKAHRLLDNAEQILAIELLVAVQAHDFLDVKRRAPKTEALHQKVRGYVRPYRDDRPMADDYARVVDMFHDGAP